MTTKRLRSRHRASMIVAGWLLSSLALAATQGDPQTDGKSPAPRARSKTAAHPVVPPVDDRAPQADPKTDPASLDLSPSVLKSAVEAADADYAPPTARGTAFGTSPYSVQAKIDRSFEAAQIGRCGGADTLKFDPLPVWGDFVMGVFALPYAFKAMATGHCKF